MEGTPLLRVYTWCLSGTCPNRECKVPSAGSSDIQRAQSAPCRLANNNVCDVALMQEKFIKAQLTLFTAAQIQQPLGFGTT